MIERARRVKNEKPFSLWFFTLIIAGWLIGFNVLLLVLPLSVWKLQYTSGVLPLLWPFLGVHLFNSFVEWKFHRYFLHSPVIAYVLMKNVVNPGKLRCKIASFFFQLYEKHNDIHHRHTEISPRKESSDSDVQIVRNVYVIEKEHQHEASYFPKSTYCIFAFFSLPFYALAQWAFPNTPVILGGLLALAFSLWLYEFRHSLDHWPESRLERWFFRWPLIGPWFKEQFKFHRGHHADVWRNMAISGFFLIPLWDFVFKTRKQPKSFYEQGSIVIAEEFEKPEPRKIIKFLDQLAEDARNWKPPIAA